MNLIFRGAGDVDVTGAEPITVEEPHAAPCRRCLTDVEPGERAFLVSYDPFRRSSPYRSASPVFVHADGCDVYEGAEVPEQQRRRLLSVRTFDEEAMMVESDVVEGERLETALDRMFRDPRAAFVHVHNAKPGCFAVRVERG
ncbi:MAG TPA: DUF1203 domain-containing protein [Nocardioidaceae bacterium]|jgi:hypothetical protein